MNVKIKNVSLVKEKLATLSDHSNLHVIIDFDSTLTHPLHTTSWGVLEHCKELSKEYHTTSMELYKKYHPLEINHSLSMKERYDAMEEWWDQAHMALLRENVTKKTFCKMVEENGFVYRERVKEFFEECERQKIPVLIFSAGLGDIIDAAVEKEKWKGNIHVLSNHLKFEEDEVAKGFKHKNIHTFSKREVVLKELHEEWANAVLERKNCLVVGDSIGDVHMAEGVEHDCVLKVGYLNNNQLGSMDEYMDNFDVVLPTDYTMSYLIDDVLNKKAQ